MQSGAVLDGGSRERTASPLGGASNVLVLSDSMDPEARGSYYRSLLPADPASLNVLAVQYTHGPDGWLDEWREHVGESPGRTTVVSVGDGRRGAAAADGGGTNYGGDDAGSTVSIVESPDDLTGLGITIGSHLERGEEYSGLTLVTLDSLTVLLQYVDLKRTFRFLHVMVNRVKSAGAIGHYHMDPDAHDEQTVTTLASVFDAVARYEDGEWRITSR
jgi:hypothetical protein